MKAAYGERGRVVNLGSKIVGRIHGKSALVEYKAASQDSTAAAECIIGSANWSDSTCANVEFGTRWTGSVTDPFVAGWRAEFDRVWEISIDPNSRHSPSPERLEEIRLRNAVR